MENSFNPISKLEVYLAVNHPDEYKSLTGFYSDSVETLDSRFTYSVEKVQGASADTPLLLYRTQDFLLYDDSLARYFQIFVFILVAACLSILLFALSYIFYQSIRRTDYFEKVSPYECGFNTFGDARETFDVRFYLVAILFLIFDLEIGYLFPWAVTLDVIGLKGLASMLYFLAILTVGYVYEWMKGALEWS